MVPADVGLRSLVRALVLAVLIGVPASLLALGLVWLVSTTTTLVWQDLPVALGIDGAPPWWFVVAVPTVGGVGVALARRLPGHAAHGPLDGFARATEPRVLPGVLLAALISLACGAVLGPEAPLLALGSALGLLVARRAATPVQQMAAGAGSFAAFSALLGNPLLTAIFLLESTAATVSAASLVPGLAASGVGYLVFTGVGDWAGIDVPAFTVEGLEPYSSVAWSDLAWAVPVSAGAALVALVALLGGRAVAARAARAPMLLAIPLGGLAVGVLGAGWVAASGQDYSLELFSGEQAIGALVGQTSATAVLLLLVLKATAYAVSLGSGFRGGPIFPALFLGATVGVLAALVLPGLGTTPAVACALAAAAAATLRLPFAAAALSLLLVGTAGAATTVLTILGSVVGYLVVRAVTTLTARAGGRPAPS
ncbi:MAG: chloride channel protein [Actinomycetia bacterium]|nr:chloride channel protein [Actinomycetes bacterium]